MRHLLITTCLLICASGCDRLAAPTTTNPSAAPPPVATSTAKQITNESGHKREGLELRGHADQICSLVFTPEGTQLVSGAADDQIKIWNVESGVCERTFKAGQEWVHGVALTSDGKLLASAGRDKCVKLWDFASGEFKSKLAGHTGIVKCVVFSPDDKTAASCGMDRFVRIWDLAEGRELKKLTAEVHFGFSRVLFSADGKRLYGAGDAFVCWDVESGKPLLGFEGHSDTVGAIALSRNEKWIASAGSYVDRSIRVWDTATGDCLWTKDFPENQGPWALAVDSDNNTLISGHFNGEIAFWDAKSGERLRIVKAHSEHISSLALAARTPLLASGGADMTIKLWSASAPAK